MEGVIIDAGNHGILMHLMALSDGTLVVHMDLPVVYNRLMGQARQSMHHVQRRTLECHT